jgi:hypothetical protein
MKICQIIEEYTNWEMIQKLYDKDDVLTLRNLQGSFKLDESTLEQRYHDDAR